MSMLYQSLLYKSVLLTLLCFFSGIHILFFSVLKCILCNVGSLHFILKYFIKVHILYFKVSFIKLYSRLCSGKYYHVNYFMYCNVSKCTIKVYLRLCGWRTHTCMYS